MRSVPARRKGGSTGRVCLCARGSCFVFQIYLAICFVYLSWPSFFFLFFLSFIRDRSTDFGMSPFGGKGRGLFLSARWGEFYLFFFFSCLLWVVSCLLHRLSRSASRFWPLNFFLFLFFFLRLYHSGCVLLSWKIIHMNIYNNLFIYIEIFTCLTSFLPLNIFFLFRGVFLCVCVCVCRFMNMTDMCKYGTKNKETEVGGIVITIKKKGGGKEKC